MSSQIGVADGMQIRGHQCLPVLVEAEEAAHPQPAGEAVDDGLALGVTGHAGVPVREHEPASGPYHP
ncbi:hypothetical protein ACFPH6_49340 [Streptomyces xiangluensis]|uniref:Uncharacterized protein n=1 Tax=Streptomyces xiangluensis TaxID=2665720 RepID=A0ABV8Z4K1_9ACTN